LPWPYPITAISIQIWLIKDNKCNHYLSLNKTHRLYYLIQISLKLREKPLKLGKEKWKYRIQQYQIYL